MSGEEIKNVNVTPIGIPALKNPIKSELKNINKTELSFLRLLLKNNQFHIIWYLPVRF